MKKNKSVFFISLMAFSTLSVAMDCETFCKMGKEKRHQYNDSIQCCKGSNSAKKIMKKVKGKNTSKKSKVSACPHGFKDKFSLSENCKCKETYGYLTYGSDQFYKCP